MKWEVGKTYYARNGREVEVTSVSGGIEGYVLYAGGDDLQRWNAEGKRSSTRKSPLDLTEAPVKSAVKPATVLRKLSEPSLAPSSGIQRMERAPAPTPIKGYVAEFVSNRPGRFISPVFEQRYQLDNFVDKAVHERGNQLVRITTVAEVPQELCA